MLALLTLNLLSMKAHCESVSRQNLRLTIVHMQKLAKEGSANLADKTFKLDLANQQLQVVQKDADNQRDWGINQSNRADEAEAKNLKLEKENSHLFKKVLIGAIVIGFVVALFTLKFIMPSMTFQTTWIGLVLPWAVGLAAFGLAMLL